MFLIGMPGATEWFIIFFMFILPLPILLIILLVKKSKNKKNIDQDEPIVITNNPKKIKRNFNNS